VFPRPLSPSSPSPFFLSFSPSASLRELKVKRHRVRPRRTFHLIAFPFLPPPFANPRPSWPQEKEERNGLRVSAGFDFLPLFSFFLSRTLCGSYRLDRRLEDFPPDGRGRSPGTPPPPSFFFFLPFLRRRRSEVMTGHGSSRNGPLPPPFFSFPPCIGDTDPNDYVGVPAINFLFLFFSSLFFFLLLDFRGSETKRSSAFPPFFFPAGSGCLRKKRHLALPFFLFPFFPPGHDVRKEM